MRLCWISLLTCADVASRFGRMLGQDRVRWHLDLFQTRLSSPPELGFV